MVEQSSIQWLKPIFGLWINSKTKKSNHFFHFRLQYILANFYRAISCADAVFSNENLNNRTFQSNTKIYFHNSEVGTYAFSSGYRFCLILCLFFASLLIFSGKTKMVGNQIRKWAENQTWPCYSYAASYWFLWQDKEGSYTFAYWFALLLNICAAFIWLLIFAVKTPHRRMKCL